MEHPQATHCCFAHPFTQRRNRLPGKAGSQVSDHVTAYRALPGPGSDL